MMDYLTDPLFWILLGWVFLPAVVCYFLALKKRRSTLFWLLAGMVLGLIGIFVLYFLPPLPMKSYKIHKDDRLDTKLKMYQNLEEMQHSKDKHQEKNINES